jgi:hypothetical protein
LEGTGGWRRVGVVSQICFGLLLPWRISRILLGAALSFSLTFCDGSVSTQHAFAAVVPWWVTLSDGVGF